MTLVRLIVFRFVRQRQWWWDDFFAFLGLLCLATFVPGKRLHKPQTDRRDDRPNDLRSIGAFLMSEGRELIHRPQL